MSAQPCTALLVACQLGRALIRFIQATTFGHFANVQPVTSPTETMPEDYYAL